MALTAVIGFLDQPHQVRAETIRILPVHSAESPREVLQDVPLLRE